MGKEEKRRAKLKRIRGQERRGKATGRRRLLDVEDKQMGNVENAVTAMNRWLRVVSNYKKQSARIKGQKAVADKKKGKKGLFGPVLNQLVCRRRKQVCTNMCWIFKLFWSCPAEEPDRDSGDVPDDHQCFLQHGRLSQAKCNSY